MAIFDEIGKKLSQTSGAVAGKAKNIADVTRINGMLSDEQKKLQTTYAKLGETYFQNYQNSPVPEVETLVADALQSLSKIDLYKEQVKRIKGVRDCPSCGADVPNGSQFCNACGYKMPDEAPKVNVPVNAVRCMTCGAIEPAGRKFCTNCGSPFNNETEAAQTLKNCAVCGNSLEADAAFCTNCGTPVAKEEIPVETVAPEENAATAEPAVPAEPEVKPNFFEQEINSQPEPIFVPETNPVPAGKACTVCGNALDADAAFCTNCGTPVATVAPAAPVCSNCGSALDPGAAFCVNCGMKQ